MRWLVVLAVLAVCVSAPAFARVVNPAVLAERSRPPRLHVAQSTDPYASPEFAGVAMQDRSGRSMQRMQAMAPMGYPRFAQNIPMQQQGPNFFAEATQLPVAPVVAPADVGDSPMRFRTQYPQPIPYQPAAYAQYQQQQPMPMPMAAQYAQYQQQPQYMQQQQQQPQYMQQQQQQYPEFLDVGSQVHTAPVNPMTDAIASAYSAERFQEGRASYDYPENNGVAPLPQNSAAGPFRFREVAPGYAPVAPAAPAAMADQAASYPNMDVAHTPTYGSFPSQRMETQGSIPPPPSMPNLPPPPVGIF